MAFQDRVDGLGARLHLSAVPRPVMAGLAALLCLCMGLALWQALSLADRKGLEISVGTVAQVQGGENRPQEGGTPGEESLASSDGGTSGAEGAVPDVPPGPGSSAAVPPPTTPLLCVHVDGAVKKPGVYYFEAGSRVIDAVESAGGFGAKAHSAAVNLAQPLEDGQQILIPTVNEASAGPSNGGNGGTAGSGSGSSSASAVPGNGASTGPVNINQAGASELVTLPGIGEATAAKIIADREANGPFRSVDDLTRVSGIGAKKLETLRDFICT